MLFRIPMMREPPSTPRMVPRPPASVMPPITTAVTAVVIGGMTLAGGRGTILGVLGGSLIIGILNNIMTLLGIGTFSQDMVRGAIFIVVVGINALSLRRLGRDDA